MIDVAREMALADFEAKLDEFQKIPREHPLDVAGVFMSVCDRRIGRLADRIKARLVVLAMEEFSKLDAATRRSAITGSLDDTRMACLPCMTRAEARFFEAVEAT